jgi:hypothetical protein
LFAYRQNIDYFVGFMYKSYICKLERNKSNFSKKCEALNFCSWYLLFLSIFFIGSAYSITYRRNIYRFVGWMHKSIEKTLEICDFHIYVVFWSCEWAPPCFCSKKTIKQSLLRPLWDPPMLTIEEVKKLIKHSIFKLLVILVLSKTSSIGKSTEPFFNDFSSAFLVKPWGEFDGNHCCFVIISKTALLENN